MEKLYNTLPYRLQNVRDVRTDTFKKHLNRWLRDIPNTPKIDNYGASVITETNRNNKW